MSDLNFHLGFISMSGGGGGIPEKEFSISEKDIEGHEGALVPCPGWADDKNCLRVRVRRLQDYFLCLFVGQGFGD